MDKGIRGQIEASGHTIGEAAERLGMSEDAMADKCERPGTFTVTEILALSVWLGIAADELLGLEGE